MENVYNCFKLRPFECLDIASSMGVNSLNGEKLFGGLFTGATNDGCVGAYDVARLLWVQFESPLYDSLSRMYSVIPTVYPRVGTAARCLYQGLCPSQILPTETLMRHTNSMDWSTGT